MSTTLVSTCRYKSLLIAAAWIPRGSGEAEFRGPEPWRFSAQHPTKFVSLLCSLIKEEALLAWPWQAIQGCCYA